MEEVAYAEVKRTAVAPHWALAQRPCRGLTLNPRGSQVSGPAPGSSTRPSSGLHLASVVARGRARRPGRSGLRPWLPRQRRRSGAAGRAPATRVLEDPEDRRQTGCRAPCWSPLFCCLHPPLLLSRRGSALFLKHILAAPLHLRVSPPLWGEGEPSCMSPTDTAPWDSETSMGRAAPPPSPGTGPRCISVSAPSWSSLGPR